MSSDAECTDPNCNCPSHDAIKRWERFQEAAHNEKGWMADRLNWMLVPQGVFFAALAWIIKLKQEAMSKKIELPTIGEKVAILDDAIKNLDNVAAMVSTLGLVLALIALVGAFAAGLMHFVWTTELNKIANGLGVDCKNKPPVVTFGMKPHWPARTTAVMPSVIALSFIFAWLFFIHGYIEDTAIKNWIYSIVVSGFILGFTFVCALVRRGDKLLECSS